MKTKRSPSYSPLIRGVRGVIFSQRSDEMSDHELKTQTIFACCLFLIETFDISPASPAYAYMNEWIYRTQRNWVITQSLNAHQNIAEGIDRACLFWQWFRHTHGLRLYKESKESKEKSLQKWFETQCLKLRRDDKLRFKVPPPE